MTEEDWKTIRVPESAFEDAKEQKEEHNRTWGQQLTHGNNVDATGENDSVNIDATDVGIVAELQQLLEQQEQIIEKQERALEYSEKTISELEQQRDYLVELVDKAADGEVGKEDIRKLQELIEKVPEQTADELGTKYV